MYVHADVNIFISILVPNIYINNNMTNIYIYIYIQFQSNFSFQIHIYDNIS